MTPIILPGDPGFFSTLERANPYFHQQRTGESYSVLPDENGIPHLYQGEELQEALLGGYYAHLINGNNLFDEDGIKEELKLMEANLKDNIHFAIDI